MSKSDKSPSEVNEIRSGGPAGLAGPAAERTRTGADRRYLIYAALVIAIAAVVRFLFISRYDIWLDEAYCFAVARKSLGDIISSLRLDNGPPLYYVMLHYWMRVFAESPAALRSLSAVFSTATVAVVVFWDTPWLSRTARLLAGFLLAITPLAIYYAQETRMYSAVVFFMLVSMVFLEKGLRAGGIRNWVLFAVFTAASFYTSYVAAFLAPLGYLVVAAQYVSDHDARSAGRRVASLVAAHLVVAALFAPWLPIFLKQPSAEATQWMRPIWNDANKRVLPFQSLTVMTAGGAFYPTLLRHLAQGPERTRYVREMIDKGEEKRALPRLLAAIPSLAPMVAACALAALMLALGLSRGGVFPFRTLLAAWVALSIVVPFALSYARPMYFVGRYELAGLPAFTILCGIGLERVRPALRAPAAALAAVLFLYSWGYMQAFPSGGDYSVRGRMVTSMAPKAAVVLCEAFEYAPVYYYAGAKRDDIQFLTFPRETISHAAWIDYDKWLQPPLVWSEPREALLREANETLLQIVDKVGPGGEFLVVRVPAGTLSWVAGIQKGLILPITTMLDAGRIEYDGAASHPELGLVLFRVLR